jgi:hypothetical protein
VDRRLGFATAGRVHAAMMIFRLVDETLEGSSFGRRNPHQDYRWTGNNFVLRRCPP